MSRELDKLLASVNKRYGSLTITKAADAKLLSRVQRVPTGIFGFDVATGGGIPVGRMTTLLGEYSSGKTALALKSAAAFQRHCRNCGRAMFDWDELTMTKTPKRCCKNAEPCRVVWFDAEGCWENDWAERLGVDVDNVYVIRTAFAEQGIDVADAVIRSGECDLLVVDSVAALTPSVEIEESAEKWQMGVHARLMNKAMRKWTSATNAGGLGAGSGQCSVILINQIRMKIGVMYGSPETSPGGKGVGFHSSMIIKVKKRGYLQSKDEMTVGLKMEIAVTKNKTAPPNRSAGFTLVFTDAYAPARVAGSTNVARQVLDLAVFWKLVRQSGAWYEMAKGIKAQGANEAANMLMASENRKLLEMLTNKVMERETGWATSKESS